MDIASITGAYQGLKATKDILTSLFDAKVDAEARAKINDALQKLSEVLETHYTLREEQFKLQEENNKLRQEIAAAQSWDAKASQYELTETTGRAVVYKFKGVPEHFICPSCFNSKQIHILQPNRTLSGKYRCTGCTSEFPVEPNKPAPRINIRSVPNVW